MEWTRHTHTGKCRLLAIWNKLINKIKYLNLYDVESAGRANGFDLRFSLCVNMPVLQFFRPVFAFGKPFGCQIEEQDRQKILV